MPNTIHGTPRPQARMQVESWPEANRLSIVSTGDRFTVAGLAAILATLQTYYAGLSTTAGANLAAAVNNQFLTVSAYRIDAAVLAADMATQAAAIVTNVRTAGNTAVNTP
jgi:hypothetical protein